LQKLGFETHVVSPNSRNGMSWGVVAGPVTSRSDAEALRAKIRQRTKMHGMTIMQSD
jgi:cell division septation protein DedD